MAIKIDLLPGYVKLRRDLHRSITACVVAAGLVLSGLLLVLQQRRLELQTAEANLAVATGVATKATSAKTAADAATTEAAPVENVINFMTASTKTGPERAALLNLVRQYIYEDAVVSSIDISDGQKVTIKATVKTPDEYARFLLNLRRASGTLFKGLPTASGPGGFANGAVPFLQPTSTGEPIPIIYPIVVTAEGILQNPVQIPPDPVSAVPAPAPGGPPGGPPA